MYEAAPHEEDPLWISERRFGRSTQVAPSGYELHVFPVLGGIEQVTLTVRDASSCSTNSPSSESDSTTRSLPSSPAAIGPSTRQTWDLRWDGVVTFEGNSIALINRCECAVLSIVAPHTALGCRAIPQRPDRAPRATGLVPDEAVNAETRMSSTPYISQRLRSGRLGHCAPCGYRFVVCDGT